jgi:uncharacterized RDD family membrane protein YckC
VIYAGMGRRALAVIVDAVLSLVVAVPLALMTGGYRNTTVVTPGRTFHTYSVSLSTVPLLLTMLIWLAYMTYMEGTSGASFGKRATGIKVVKVDGSPMDLHAALVRNVLRVVDGLFLYLVGVLLALNSPTRQRLGDRMAGTVVVPASVQELSPFPAGGQPRSTGSFGSRPHSSQDAS